MPRKARILVPNYPHYIVQRGHNRKVVLLVNEDYQRYLENLERKIVMFPLRLIFFSKKKDFIVFNN